MPRKQLVLIATSVEDRISDDHPVRLLDEILDRLDWSEWEGSYNRQIGQPPIHPSILCKVLLFAMTRRLRSSRQIEYNIKHSLDFIWLVSGRTIDHTTISEFRRKHGSQLRSIYRQMVRYAVEMGVAKLSELCIDGTRVLASANRYKTWTAARVEKLLAELDGQIEKAMSELDVNDSIDELFDDGQPADKVPAELVDLQARRTKLDEIREQLQQMDASRKANGIDPQKNPAQLPKTDLDSRILPNKEGGYAPNYTPMAVTETTNGFIVDADVLIGNVEHLSLTTSVDTITLEYDVDIETVMGDTTYSCGENLTGMEERDIELLAPLAEPKCDDNPALRDDLTSPVPEEDLDRLPINAQTKRFDKSAFVYDQQQDCYFCPAGKKLPRSGQEKKTRGDKTSMQINFTCYDCHGCRLAKRCRKNPDAKKGRRVTHDEHEAARRRHRSRMKQPKSKERYKVRQHFGETPFAVLKACFDMRRFLLRGIEGVRTEWLWGCTAFNLKKLMSLIAAMRAESAESVGQAISCGT